MSMVNRCVICDRKLPPYSGAVKCGPGGLVCEMEIDNARPAEKALADYKQGEPPPEFTGKSGYWS